MIVKTTIFVMVLCLGQVLAAPRPVDWRELGRNIGRGAINLGKQALPVGCQLLTGQPAQPPPPQIYYVNPYQYPFPAQTPNYFPQMQYDSRNFQNNPVNEKFPAQTPYNFPQIQYNLPNFPNNGNNEKFPPQTPNNFPQIQYDSSNFRNNPINEKFPAQTQNKFPKSQTDSPNFRNNRIDEIA